MLFKGRDLIGKAITSYDAGKKFDLVKVLILIRRVINC